MSESERPAQSEWSWEMAFRTSLYGEFGERVLATAAAFREFTLRKHKGTQVPLLLPNLAEAVLAVPEDIEHGQADEYTLFVPENIRGRTQIVGYGLAEGTLLRTVIYDFDLDKIREASFAEAEDQARLGAVFMHTLGKGTEQATSFAAGNISRQLEYSVVNLDVNPDKDTPENRLRMQLQAGRHLHAVVTGQIESFLGRTLPEYGPGQAVDVKVPFSSDPELIFDMRLMYDPETRPDAEGRIYNISYAPLQEDGTLDSDLLVMVSEDGHCVLPPVPTRSNVDPTRIILAEVNALFDAEEEGA